MPKNNQYYFDDTAAQRPCNFIERYCTHVEGRLLGEYIQLTPYHRELIEQVFGNKRVDNNKRRYRFVYQEIPKKNGKSIILAAIGLYMTGYDGEKGARVGVVAADKDQAKIIHETAKKMIEADDKLSEQFDIYTDYIHHRRTHSTFKVLSGSVRGKHGPDWSCIIFDEMHEQKNSELWDTLSKGVAARSQPLVFALTTAGYRGTFAEELSRAAYKVHMGVEKSEFWFTQFFGIRDEHRALKEYDKVKLWKEANPGYGITVDKDYFRFQMEEIKKMPSKISGFLRLHLNVWTGNEVSWSVLPYWNGCDHGVINESDLYGRVCYGGLDKAKSEDTNSLVWVFPPDESNDYYVALVRCWIPSETVQRRVEQENVNFREWVRSGIVSSVVGNVVGDSEILEVIISDSEKFDCKLLLSDPYNATQIVKDIQLAGIEADLISQTSRHTCGPLKKWEGFIRDGTFSHGGNALYMWQASNAMTVELEHDNYYLSKRKSVERIDCLSATVNAFAALDYEKQEETYSAADILGK